MHNLELLCSWKICQYHQQKSNYFPLIFSCDISSFSKNGDSTDGRLQMALKQLAGQKQQLFSVITVNQS